MAEDPTVDPRYRATSLYGSDGDRAAAVHEGLLVASSPVLRKQVATLDREDLRLTLHFSSDAVQAYAIFLYQKDIKAFLDETLLDEDLDDVEFFMEVYRLGEYVENVDFMDMIMDYITKMFLLDQKVGTNVTEAIKLMLPHFPSESKGRALMIHWICFGTNGANLEDLGDSLNTGDADFERQLLMALVRVTASGSGGKGFAAMPTAGNRCIYHCHPDHEKQCYRERGFADIMSWTEV